MTIYEIAEICNVSISTVSRVLNDKSGVKKEIREKVQKVIEENNFRPNLLARGLTSKKTNVIGVVMPGINSYYSDRIDAINKVCKEKGYSIMITANYKTKNNLEDDIENIDILSEKQVDGIIYFASRFTEMHIKIIEETVKKIPVVVTDFNIKNNNIPCVVQDNSMGIKEVMDYLVSIGHKRIAFIKGVYYASDANERFETYKKKLKEKKLELKKEYIGEGTFSINSGHREMKKILENSTEHPTAVICANDDMAIGALRAVQEFGLKVPDDISVIGYDDMNSSKYLVPSLTTVNLEHNKIGENAAEMLLNLIDGKKIENRVVVIKPNLVIRESSGSIKNKE